MNTPSIMHTLCNIIHKNDRNALEKMIGEYPLLISTYHQHDSSCKIFDRNYQSDYSFCYHDKMMPLHIAVSADAYDCTQLLLTQKADPNSKSLQGNYKNATSLHVAKNATLTHLLLQFGAQVDETRLYGETPLEVALLSNAMPNFSVALVLINYNANVNHIDPISKKTLLHKAIAHRSFIYEIVSFLLKHGANRMQTNQSGKTPLQYALQLHNGFEELIDLLQRN